MGGNHEELPPLWQLARRPLRTCLYARDSNDRAGRSRSVPMQFSELEGVCATGEWPIADRFRDDDKSASPYAQEPRPDYERMVARLRAGLYDMVAVTDSSRLSRNVEEWLPLRSLLREMGVLLCIGGTLYDMRRDQDRATVTRMIQSAEEEADSIATRNRRTQRTLRSEGKVFSRAPYGYRREYDPGTGDLLRQVPNEQVGPGDVSPADVVREIVKRVGSGHHLKAIAASLQDRGIPTPREADKGWQGSVVRYIAKNPAYAAYRNFQGQRVSCDWDALVSEEEHLAAVVLLSDPQRVGPGRRSDARYLLSSIVACGREGCTGRHRRYPKSGSADDVYACGTCKRCAISLPWLDDYVTALVLAWLEHPGRADMILSAGAPAETSAALAELQRLRAELAETYELASSGELSAVGLAAVERSLLPRIRRATALVEVPAVSPVLIGAAAGERAREVWAEMALMERRLVIRSVMAITVAPLEGRVTGLARVAFRPERVRVEWLLGA